MSGHSKWATIRRSKAANDSKRGQVFTKIGHEIALAAREGGADPDANFRLRIVLEKARQANMPKDNIERAIKRGAGGAGEGSDLIESIYEGYGPHGTAIMVQVLTDNKNRTVSDVRRAFVRHGGNLGEGGCVAWMFSRKGSITINPGDGDPEEIALEAIDAGAEDVEIDEDSVEITIAPEDFKRVLEALTAASYAIENSQLTWVAQSHMTMEEKGTLQTMKLVESLEELEDVQEVFSNLDLSDEMIAKFETEAA